MFNIKKETEEIVDVLSEDEVAEKLNAEVVKRFQEGRGKADSDDCPEDLMPEERLSETVAAHLALLTAERFDRMIDGMDLSVAKQIADRLEHSEPETMVSMLQAMFLANGMVHAAEDLDILKDCEAFDVAVYCCFQDELSDTETFDWFRIERLLEEECDEACPKLIMFPMEVS